MPGQSDLGPSTHPHCPCVCICVRVHSGDVCGGGGGTILLTHVAMLPSPAWGALALVWSGADTSIKTRLGANGWGTFEKRVKTQTQGQLPIIPPTA